MDQTYRRNIRRGDVYIADLDPVTGSEQGGTRPVVVLQNNMGNKHSPTVIVSPFTSEIKKKQLPTHVYVSNSNCLEVNSMAMLEQVRVLDKQHLKEYLGYLSRYDMDRLDEALRISLGLDEVMELCLCPKCAGAFYNRPNEYRIYRTDMTQMKTEKCMFCQVNYGYDHKIITHRSKGYGPRRCDSKPSVNILA